MGFIISLILVGLILILAEILLVPGVGVTGILGLASLGGACYFAFARIGCTAGYVVTAVVVLLVVVTMIYVLRAKTWKKLTLDTDIDSRAISADSRISVGDKGLTMTRLAPMGSVRFGNDIVEAKALKGMLDPDLEVEVIMIEDGKIYVRPVENSEFE